MNNPPFESHFNEDDLENIENQYRNVLIIHDEIFLKFQNLSIHNVGAKEFLLHGFLRRLRILRKCLINVFDISSPCSSEKLNWEEKADLEINLHAFIINLYGCMDNLCWIMAKEKKFSYKKKTQISFSNKDFLKIFSKSFQEYIGTREKWIEHVSNIRHALAHRIPIYVPPCAMNEEEYKRDQEIDSEKFTLMRERQYDKIDGLEGEQRKLGKFIPVYLHSYSEESPRVFYHPQMLADTNTIFEMCSHFLSEFDK